MAFSPDSLRSVIIASGRYIPPVRVSNGAFASQRFYEKSGAPVEVDSGVVCRKVSQISGIEERRYALPGQVASELGYRAALNALQSSGVDPETLDYVIVAHNFGDVAYGSNRVDTVPSLASRIKALLGISNPACIAYDLAFGCPGWVEGLIQANYYLRSGDATRCLVIGTETLSRVVDPYDRDSMLFADGSGAVVLQAASSGRAGILSHVTRTFATDYVDLLRMDRSAAPELADSGDLYMKMNGRKLYEFALQEVPLVVQAALDKAGLELTDVKKVLIHQANQKMDEAILERLFRLNGKGTPPSGLMPMSIAWLGNSSVATVPTLLDLLLKGELSGHDVQEGDTVVFASVGAGMNINAVVYRF